AALDLLDALHRRPKQLLDAGESFRAPALVDLEDLVLGFVEELGGRRARLESLGDDGGGNFDQPAPKRLLTHDSRVVLDVGRGGNGVDEKADVILATARFQRACSLQLLRECQRVDYIATLRECDHRPKNPTVSLAIEH